MQALANAGSALQWVVQRRSDDKVIGTVLLFKWDAGKGLKFAPALLLQADEVID